LFVVLIDRLKNLSYNISMITTQKQLRELFWKYNSEFETFRRARKKQNDYNATIRSTWVEFVNWARNTNTISEKLANRATL